MSTLRRAQEAQAQTAAIAANKEYTLELGDQKLTIKTGMLANQTSATALCQMGDTVSMSNVTLSRTARSGVDFLPLQVVYQEKYYAGGKIGGGRFSKREGRLEPDFGLLGRIVDGGLWRSFPQHFHHDLQVFCSVLSIAY